MVLVRVQVFPERPSLSRRAYAFWQQHRPYQRVRRSFAALRINKVKDSTFFRFCGLDEIVALDFESSARGGLRSANWFPSTPTKAGLAWQIPGLVRTRKMSFVFLVVRSSRSAPARMLG